MLNLRMLFIVSFVLSNLFWAVPASAHPHHSQPGHKAPTYEMTAPAEVSQAGYRLILSIVDSTTGKPIAARFGFEVDGRPYVPAALNKHGIRFVSIHTSKKQRATVLYSRGTGAVELALPKGARQGELFVTKGYEFLTQQIPFEISDSTTTITVRLTRWSKLRQQGWISTEEHLHYERTDPVHDADWLTILRAEGLVHAHFMVLKGGNLPGIWAQQYAYGKKGQGTDGTRLLVPGEEFRGRKQGHINLLGLGKVIAPITVGGQGKPPHPYNYPALHDVFLQARRSGGIGGPAHGGAYGGNPTAVVDTVLGAAEFFEISNTHLYYTELWYRLLNCGYMIAPAAGTDLPNFPFRDRWQPLLGETRMVVKVGRSRDFETWKSAVRNGEVFVSSGPMLRFEVGGAGLGKTVHLPAGGGEVMLAAELAFQQPLQSFEIIRNAQPIDVDITKSHLAGVHRWKIHQPLRINQSCWLAARATGPKKAALEKQTGIKQNTMAHTAAIRVIVGNQPITSPKDAKQLVSELTAHQEAYRSSGRFQKDEHRKRMLTLFQQAIDKLQQQAAP